MKKRYILLTLLFPGIIQIMRGNTALGSFLLVLNGLSFYTLWWIIMPVALGFTLRAWTRDERKAQKVVWQKEINQILSSTS